MANPSPPLESTPIHPREASPAPSRNRLPWLRMVKYLLVAGLINGALWGFALSYLKKTKPVYVSQLTLNVAGSGQGVNVNVPDIGQATTSTTSAFGSTADPRENYKLMLSSSTVLETAARSLDLDPEKFGEPKIKIVNNTTMMELSISGQDPALTQKKALALYRALSARLNILRTGEQSQRNEAIQKAVTTAQTKLTAAQSRLSAYKSASGLNSNAQVTNLINTIESLRQQRAQLIAQTQQAGDRQKQLSRNLQLSPQLAADALLLQTDQQFQKSLQDYSKTAIELKVLLENRGENYPDVIALKNQQDSLRNALLQRGQALLNKPLNQMTLERLNLDNSNGSGVKRGELFQQLILANAEYQGLIGQKQALSEQIENLEQRLGSLTQKQSVLDRYLRDVQIAEAIFTSTLAKVDLSKSDPYGSFPLLQLVEEPNQPSTPSAPQPKLVMIGASLGSFLVTVGLTLVWWRNPILKFSKRALREILS